MHFDQKPYFDLTAEACRRVGAIGGRRSARNRRLRNLVQAASQTTNRGRRNAKRRMKPAFCWTNVFRIFVVPGGDPDESLLRRSPTFRVFVFGTPEGWHTGAYDRKRRQWLPMDDCVCDALVHAKRRAETLDRRTTQAKSQITAGILHQVAPVCRGHFSEATAAAAQQQCFAAS
jgi:hypothetical protein